MSRKAELLGSQNTIVTTSLIPLLWYVHNFTAPQSTLSYLILLLSFSDTLNLRRLLNSKMEQRYQQHQLTSGVLVPTTATITMHGVRADTTPQSLMLARVYSLKGTCRSPRRPFKQSYQDASTTIVPDAWVWVALWQFIRSLKISRRIAASVRVARAAWKLL